MAEKVASMCCAVSSQPDGSPSVGGITVQAGAHDFRKWPRCCPWIHAGKERDSDEDHPFLMLWPEVV
eukprot:SAG31_NODE_3346_length_4376_cov_3.801496_5_plen_66_part_01